MRLSTTLSAQAAKTTWLPQKGCGAGRDSGHMQNQASGYCDGRFPQLKIRNLVGVPASGTRDCMISTKSHSPLQWAVRKISP